MRKIIKYSNVYGFKPNYELIKEMVNKYKDDEIGKIVLFILSENLIPLTRRYFIQAFVESGKPFTCYADENEIHRIDFVPEDGYGTKFGIWAYEKLENMIHGFMPNDVVLMDFSSAKIEHLNFLLSAYFPTFYSGHNPSNITITGKEEDENEIFYDLCESEKYEVETYEC